MYIHFALIQSINRSRYTQRMPKTSSKNVTDSEKCDLILNSARFRKKLETGKYSDRYDAALHIYITAFMEYLTRMMFNEAGKVQQSTKSIVMTRTHLRRGIQNDPDLRAFFASVDIPEVATTPFVSKAHITKPKRKRPVKRRNSE